MMVERKYPNLEIYTLQICVICLMEEPCLCGMVNLEFRLPTDQSICAENTRDGWQLNNPTNDLMVGSWLVNLRS